jgi:hypothetical protein
MIPAGSGAFPVSGNVNGFAPSSPGFNAMYGLPDDPFAGSQSGSPGWMPNPGSGNSGPGSPPPQNQEDFPPGPVDLNDPHLAEIIRQYSQKGQGVQQQQQMPPNGQQQQMPLSQPGSPIPQREPRNPSFRDSNWLQ